jgi:hypothetical protein
VAIEKLDKRVTAAKPSTPDVVESDSEYETEKESIL